MGKEVALGREGEEVCFAPDARSTFGKESTPGKRYRC